MQEATAGTPWGSTSAHMYCFGMTRGHIAANMGIGPDDFGYAPFPQAVVEEEPIDCFWKASGR